MKCQRTACGREIQEDALYCPYCGKKQQRTAAPKPRKRANGKGCIYRSGKTWTIQVRVVRAGTVVYARKKCDKLLCFTLNDGSGTDRQILSGIAKYYRPEELVGKTVVAILNLPPRKMMGLESNGMLLSAVREIDGKEELHLMILDDSVPAGSQLC
mgnify:CR=1 FL=1